jgi:hypothetical protein
MAVLMDYPHPPHPVQLYNLLWNKARRDNLVPTRWQLSMWHLNTGGRLETLLGLPVYYASDTKLDCVILETNRGDVVETRGFEEDN